MTIIPLKFSRYNFLLELESNEEFIDTNDILIKVLEVQGDVFLEIDGLVISLIKNKNYKIDKNKKYKISGINTFSILFFKKEELDV